MTEPSSDDWSPAASADLYQLRGWGEPYFLANAAGHLEVRPDPTRPDEAIDLLELTESLQARGLELPLLIRFSDILQDRIRRLNECFAKAMAEYDYKGSYQGVFPVKVNQQAHVVDEVVAYGQPWNIGLEAGSKPELLIALAATPSPGGFIVCNGYKDDKYIETALLAQCLGKQVVIVLERLEELTLAMRVSEREGIAPMLGVRAKLTAKGMGRWAESGGDRAKFGLTAAEIVHVVDELSRHGMLDCLRMLHFHIGSQISSILAIKNALREASHVYVELIRMGAPMGYLNVGGGLAVDYDGSKTDFHASKNYNTQEYAYDVVAALEDACSKASVAAPTIVSESGRSIAAHQSVLVFDILGKSQMRVSQPETPASDAHRVILELHETWQGIAPKNVQESYHDALQGKEEADSLFKFGYLSLRERARAERLFWSCCHKIVTSAQRLKRVPEEVQELEEALKAIYYGNFSIFQSLPDSWAIEQMFPVMPLHRLEERPDTRAVIADLTCDSDGKLDRFIDVEDVKSVLPVHALRSDEPYYLGIFLTGAYQETLGDLHNLFGDTNAVHVRLTDQGHYEVANVVKGDSIAEVLSYVEHDPAALVERVRVQAERAQRRGEINVDKVRKLTRHLEASMASYTYLTER